MSSCRGWAAHAPASDPCAALLLVCAAIVMNYWDTVLKRSVNMENAFYRWVLTYGLAGAASSIPFLRFRLFWALLTSEKLDLSSRGAGVVATRLPTGWAHWVQRVLYGSQTDFQLSESSTALILMDVLEHRQWPVPCCLQ